MLLLQEELRRDGASYDVLSDQGGLSVQKLISEKKAQLQREGSVRNPDDVKLILLISGVSYDALLETAAETEGTDGSEMNTYLRKVPDQKQGAGWLTPVLVGAAHA